MKLISWRKEGHDYVMTLEVPRGFLWWRKLHTVTVRGDCTLWAHYPSGKNVDDVFARVRLTEAWKRIEWGVEAAKEEVHAP